MVNMRIDGTILFFQFRNTTDDVLFGILLLNILVDFAPHLFEMGLHHIVVNKNVVLVGHGRRI